MEDALMSNIDNITDDHLLVLQLVLLRVPSPACLVRAAATCKLWRGVIADGGFLRLYRSLNPPAVPGYYVNIDLPPPSPTEHRRIIRPSFLPSPSAAALAIDTRHFSLDFLPDGPRGWTILDSRGSLLLMKDLRRCVPTGFPAGMLLVCEPLTRRCKRIPPPPNYRYSTRLYGCYLVDGNADEVVSSCIGMSNFRVLCELHRGGVTHAGFFTTGGGADSWSEKAIDSITPPRLHQKRFFGRAGDSWYFLVGDRSLVALDGHTGEYSLLVLPSNDDWPRHLWSAQVFITDDRYGKPRIFSAEDNIMKVYARLDSGSCEWVLEKKLPLQKATCGLPGYKSSFFNYPLLVYTWGPGFVTLITLGREQWFFSVDLETMEVNQPAAAPEDMQHMLYRCELPWPPVLHVCLDR